MLLVAAAGWPSVGAVGWRWLGAVGFEGWAWGAGQGTASILKSEEERRGKNRREILVKCVGSFREERVIRVCGHGAHGAVGCFRFLGLSVVEY